MQRITSKFHTYPLAPKFSQLRHIKYADQAKLTAPTRPKAYKKAFASLTTSKSLKLVKFENVEGIPSKWYEWFFRGMTKSFRVLKKVVFASSSFDHALKAQTLGLKKILKNITHLETLSLVYFDAKYLKYLRSLKNLKLSIPDSETSPASTLSKLRHLRQLEKVEVCVSDEDQALNILKEVHHRVKAPHCCLDITLMKAFWPYCDNIESIAQQSFKKVASVELNLAKLPAIPVVDNSTLEAHLKFLKFLFEPAGKSRRRRHFECLKFPGMKLNIDRKEYDSPPKVYSLLENFLSVYDSSVFHVKEYSPENNLAKLYFELTSWASSWEILELLKDIIEIKDIRFLHLELDVKGMTEREFNNIIEKICKIERLQFLYVASGTFSMEVKHPAGKLPAGLAGSDSRSMVESRG